MEELARLLREQGATNIKRNGQVMSCKFKFVGGDDCGVTIEFADGRTITTGSAQI
jgi:hypothetical protein